MKTLKYLAIFALIISSQALIARNKDRIIIKNKFGAPIDVVVQYRSVSGLHMRSNQSYRIEKNKKATIVGKTSDLQFLQIYACPSIVNMGKNIGQVANVTSVGLGTGTATAIAAGGGGAGLVGAAGLPIMAVGAGVALIGISITEILKSLDNASTKAHGHTFFVVKNNGKPSKLAGQKQIVIKGYASEQHYHEETAALVQPVHQEEKIEESASNISAIVA